MGFLQIASWNIEHLGGQPRAARRQSAYALADHIEMAGVDLIVLQEVYVTDADEQVRLAPSTFVVDKATDGAHRNGDLDVVCHLLREHDDDETPWAYRILPNRNAGDRSQLCAVMWNTGRLKLDQVLALDVPHDDGGDSLWDRTPHVVGFTSEIRVWRKGADGTWEQKAEPRGLSIVPLHMKSNVGGVTRNRRVRQKEASTLCEALTAVKGRIDPSLVLLGDTNILQNTEPAIETFLDAGFVDLNNHDGATYWSKEFGESPFDRIFVPEGRDEFRYTRQYVLRSSDLVRHDRFLSDHYMIKASIKDYVDDGDPRPT